MTYEATDLAFRYAGASVPAVDAVNLAVPAGGFYAVIGPNGCGKTTLLRLLLGVLQPDRGTVRYRGRNVARWERRDLARRVGVVAQLEPIVFPLSVRDLVSMGRYPHLGSWRGEGRADRTAIARALETCDIASLADRPVGTLSGGELQRARLARALAQEPETLVLDEPTASLDIGHEMSLFELLRSLADQGVTVLIVTHNLNVAARFADRLLLMDRGRPAAEGEPHNVVTRANLEQVYGWPLTVSPHVGSGPDAGAPQVVPLRAPTGVRPAPYTNPQEHDEPNP